MAKRLIGILVALIWVVIAVPLAIAHPHIWIDVRTKVHFDDAGAITHLSQIFEFDKLTSAWAVEGMDKNQDGLYSPDELTELADANLTNLGEFSYYTFMGVGQPNAPFSHAANARLEHRDEILTLKFDLFLQTPLSLTDALGDIEVIDPGYYIAFTFDRENGVELVNAPQICETRVLVPQELDPDTAQRLLDLDANVTQLPDDLAQATNEITNRIDINCTGTPFEPVDALQAIDELQVAAQDSALPQSTAASSLGSAFGFAPQETTIFGQDFPFLRQIWAIQREFANDLKNAFEELALESSSLWFFLALCFGYGIFHAAGPGHGKAVVSSYVLANERSLKRGIFLAFASALVQGLVAIVLIWGVSEIFNFTFADRQVATIWLERIAFTMVMLLGGYMVVTKLARMFMPRPAVAAAGHAHHDHAHDHHHHGHDHAHCNHDHMADPSMLENDFSFKKALALVFSVGLRPCTGSMLVLIFAAQQGLILAGALGVGLISLGTAITVSLLAALAVFAKNTALQLFGSDKGGVNGLSNLIELLGAIAIFTFGALLLSANLLGTGVLAP